MTNVLGSLLCPIFRVLETYETQQDIILQNIKTLKMGQTSEPKTLVMRQKMTPGNNPEDFKQL